MNEEKKKSKKRVLTYYLILAACILIIAAITVAVIFAVNNSRGNLTIDNNQTDEGEDGGEDDDSQNTASKYEFIAPMAEIDMVTSYTFGQHPLGHYEFHTGIDLAAEAGAEVFACLDGTVESILTNHVLDGTKITLVHENGIKTVYTFIEPVATLKVGDTVSRGDVIATVAAASGSEYKLGAHLHFEVYADEKPVDPEAYLDLNDK